MLDEKDLQAIAQLMDVKLDQQKQDIIQTVNVIIENKVQTQLNLIVENQQIIMDKLDRKIDHEEFEDRVSVLEGVARNHSHDIAELKKAN